MIFLMHLLKLAHISSVLTPCIVQIRAQRTRSKSSSGKPPHSPSKICMATFCDFFLFLLADSLTNSLLKSFVCLFMWMCAGSPYLSSMNVNPRRVAVAAWRLPRASLGNTAGNVSGESSLARLTSLSNGHGKTQTAESLQSTVSGVSPEAQMARDPLLFLCLSICDSMKRKSVPWLKCKYLHVIVM